MQLLEISSFPAYQYNLLKCNSLGIHPLTMCSKKEHPAQKAPIYCLIPGFSIS
jgi:hypothetical protein